uniref:DYW domain-containing protein n=1 Tax=Rhizophora mucronata TaxID=61149 RepID=A0A2P2Q685_RHIMU
MNEMMLSLLHSPPLPRANQNLTTDVHNFNSPLELKQLHAHLTKNNASLGILPPTKVASSCGLSSSNCFSYAQQQQVFSCIGVHDETPSWNSRLRGFAESDRPADAIFLFHQMLLFGISADAFTCSFVLKACVRLVDDVYGRIVHGFVVKLGFGSHLFLQNMILHLYAVCGEMGNAMLLFEKMPQRDVVTWNILITQFLKMGDIENARGFFSRMPERNIRSWTLMISGYVRCGKPKEAIDLFLKLEEEGLHPNEVTVVSVLAACADLCALDLGRRVHEYLNKSGFKRNVRVCNTLIDMYVKSGCLEHAREVFDEMAERTVVSWSAMIAGLAMHGQALEALSLFSEMIQGGLKPNGVTFIGLLHACSHMGLVEDGRRFFDSMTRNYGIIPQIEHYGCMVDLLSRAGLLQEAHYFIINMPIKPNSVVWGSFLGGCKVHKNIELAEEAMKHLSELDPLNDGYYVVLSNIYAEVERWEDAARVRTLMKRRGVKKTPGLSLITINGKVHEFVAGDETHHCTEEIFLMWDTLLCEMKLRGYVAKTSVVLLDIDEKEKEKLLYRHSEKLAVVFGLIKTPAGTPIRIIKNLRVCEDCHNALKLISAIAKREIVVRDRNRFHCFKEGYCSCRDYW